jgi:hypothetical protein
MFLSCFLSIAAGISVAASAVGADAIAVLETGAECIVVSGLIAFLKCLANASFDVLLIVVASGIIFIITAHR